MSDKVRLQKLLAEAGLTSRRKAETLIAQGRVKVNGTVVSTPGVKVDPAKDHIQVDGDTVRPATERVVIAFHKPTGVVSTMSDPEGRPTVAELLPPTDVRLFPVGRLDYDSEGLMIFTNDGDLAQKIAHPSFEVAKRYRVKVRGIATARTLNKLRTGVKLDDGMTAPGGVTGIHPEEKNTWFNLTIHEGRNQQVKRMCLAVGHPLMRLRRTAIGPIRLGSLKAGEFRLLEPEEITALREGRKTTRRPARPAPRGKPPTDGKKHWRKGGPKPGAPEGAPPEREAPKREASKQEAPRRESPRREPLRREAPRRETPRREASRREAPRRESPRHEGPTREHTRREAPRREVSRRETPRREAPGRETSRRESPRREASRRDGPGRDDSRRETVKRDSPRRKAPRRESPMREATSRDASRQEAPRRQSPKRATPKRVTSKREAPRGKGAPKKSSPKDSPRGGKRTVSRPRSRPKR